MGFQLIAIGPLGLTVLGGVVYHLGQKGAGGIGSPWPVLVVAYGVGLATAALLWWALPAGARAPGRGELGAAAAIGVGALLIEAGFFLAYRAGWALGTTALLSNLGVTLVLATVGVIALGEPIGLPRAAGVVLAALGAFLVVRG